MEDLLDVDIGKHDYDWLLTPPGTPRDASLDRIEKKPVSTVPKRTVTRSSSTTRASRLSNSQPEHTTNGHTTPSTNTRPVRSSSVTRSSVSRPSLQSSITTNSNTNTNTNTNRTSVLNTSTVSVTSSRPSTPTKRTTAPSLTKSSTPPVTTTRSVSSRSSTPVKSRPVPTSTVTKPGPTSRSSTPTRPRSATSISTGPAPTVTRSVSRSSTPTRQPIGRSPSVGRSATNSSGSSVRRAPLTAGLSSAPSSRPSSPSQRQRAPVRPLDIPDFPNETPPNLRTKLPERPASAGRVRPGMALSLRGAGPDTEPTVAAPAVSVSPNNKKVSPMPSVNRSKFSDVPSKVSVILSNGHQNKTAGQVQKSVGPAADSTGFGRTISKKSLDMAIRHMDIRQNLGGIRGASLFPHSIRSNTNSTKSGTRPARMSDPVGRPTRRLATTTTTTTTTTTMDESFFSENGSCNGANSADSNGAISRNGEYSPDRGENLMLLRETLNELDLYGSSRYDAMLLREDTKNTSWLHGIDDKSNQSPVFDHRFEPLPEPFGPL